MFFDYRGEKCPPKKTEIKICLQSKGYAPPPPESVQNSNADQRQSEYPIPPPLKVCKTQILTKDNQNILALPLGPMAHLVCVS